MSRWQQQDQYQMPSQNMMMQMASNGMPPLLPPPMFMADMMNMNDPSMAPNQVPLIGPVKPDDMENGPEMNEDTVMTDDFQAEGQGKEEDGRSKDQSGNRRDSRNRDGGRGRERDRGRYRSPHHNDRDRFNKSRSDKERDRDSRDRGRKSDRGDKRSERRSKWQNDGERAALLPNPDMPLGVAANMGMMQYNNMNQVPPNMQNMGMSNMGMPNMGIPNAQMGMPNVAMPNVGMPNVGMPNVGMSNQMPGMNIMPNYMMNMMDPNMMMMNQQNMIMPANQTIFLSNAALLPPVPGTPTPNRRERPNGCRSIFVGGLPQFVTEDVLTEIFIRFGSITNVKLRQGAAHMRFDREESVEQSFMVSGYRFKTNDQMENEATTMFVDYALNREDQNEYERNRRLRPKTPPPVEPFSPQALVAVTEKIKSEDLFCDAAPTLTAWLERGECNKKNAATFYSLIQASNNQTRRLFIEKMAFDEEYISLKSSMKEKFAKVVLQFEQVEKILTAAKHQRVSDHFTKQQRRNIDMWLKMTGEVENIKEEFNANFDEEDIERIGKETVPLDKYEVLKSENENLVYELEGYKNEAHLAKDEAERKFEKFKAQFIANQALQSAGNQIYPPLPPMPPGQKPPLPSQLSTPHSEEKPTPVNTSEAKLISLLTAFLLVHPLGASIEYLVSYIKSMVPASATTVSQVLEKYPDVFSRQTHGIGASIEHRWRFIMYEKISQQF